MSPSSKPLFGAMQASIPWRFYHNLRVQYVPGWFWIALIKAWWLIISESVTLFIWQCTLCISLCTSFVFLLWCLFLRRCVALVRHPWRGSPVRNSAAGERHLCFMGQRHYQMSLLTGFQTCNKDCLHHFSFLIISVAGIQRAFTVRPGWDCQ